MPFDGFVMAAVRQELSESLTGLRIDKIHQPSKEEIHLTASKTGTKLRLLLSADSGSARIHLTTQAPKNPPSPPVFCMVMRKHLEGGHIQGVSQQGYDRTLIISVNSRDELGRISEKQIICEVMGKHSNIILYDPVSNTILDGIKRYSHAVSRHREVLPGLPYVPAPPQQKLNPLNLNEEEFFQLIMENSLGSKISEVIQRHFDGLSPLLAREMVWKAGLDPNSPLNIMGQVDLTSIYLVLRDIYQKAENGFFTPTLLSDKNVPKDYAAIEISHLNGLHPTGGTMNQILDHFFTQRNVTVALEGLRHSLLTLIKKEMTRSEKKLSAQLKDLKSASDADAHRHHGELIKANIHRLHKGDQEVMLEDYFSEGCPRIKIDLVAHLTPVENAQRLFQKYNKAKKVLENATTHAENTKNELDYLAGLETYTELAETPEELNQIKSELVEQGYLKPSGPKRSSVKEQNKPQPAVFISQDNITILAGKNNRQNDYLTMKMARPDDIWLHTREIPGSHIIIRTGGEEVPPSTLEQAASLAALFSRAKNSSKVPVDYTLRKFVNKPKGAKPGFVIYTNFKTIITDPDPSLAEQLGNKKNDG